jgi:hypothetical protein
LQARFGMNNQINARKPAIKFGICQGPFQNCGDSFKVATLKGGNVLDLGKLTAALCIWPNKLVGHQRSSDPAFSAAKYSFVRRRTAR